MALPLNESVVLRGFLAEALRQCGRRARDGEADQWTWAQEARSWFAVHAPDCEAPFDGECISTALTPDRWCPTCHDYYYGI